MRLLRGDCRDTMAGLAFSGELFDAIVTDPPYHLTSVVERFGKPGAAPAKSNGATGVYARSSVGFMGKSWDGGDVAFQPESWRAAYDVLKPGGHLIAFGGSRTYHRIACAIEDAGFELRDSLMWIYGTGFPKSHDVSKGVDKHMGRVGTFGEPKSAAHAGWIDRGRMRGDDNEAGWQRPWMDDPEQVSNAARKYIPATPEAERWQGWGSALKPAFEPIILARKPLDGTIAANVLRHGVGGINIDGCRVPLADNDKLQDGISGREGAALDTTDTEGAWGFKAVDREAGLGRFPANVLHDGSDEVMAAFAAFGDRSGGSATARSVSRAGEFLDMRRETTKTAPGGSGSAARFFYSAKASAADRAGSKHPTVKPLALMRWLCTLVTPPGGRILDPFARSGTTLQAGYECGFDVTGCEQDPQYQADIEARIMTVLFG